MRKKTEKKKNKNKKKHKTHWGHCKCLAILVCPVYLLSVSCHVFMKLFYEQINGWKLLWNHRSPCYKLILF